MTTNSNTPAYPVDIARLPAHCQMAWRVFNLLSSGDDADAEFVWSDVVEAMLAHEDAVHGPSLDASIAASQRLESVLRERTQAPHVAIRLLFTVARELRPSRYATRAAA